MSYKYMIDVNQKNLALWKKNFVKVENSEDDCCTMTSCEDGSYKPAEPLNNDPEMQKYGAVYDIITTAVKNRDYKIYMKGDKELVDFYTKEPLKKYDVILLIDNFEYPMPFFIFMGTAEHENCVSLLWIYDDDVRELKPVIKDY